MTFLVPILALSLGWILSAPAPTYAQSLASVDRKCNDLARVNSDNLRKKDQLEIERLDAKLGADMLPSGAVGAEMANGLLLAVREYTRARSTNEADLRDKERTIAIEIDKRKIGSCTSKYFRK